MATDPVALVRTASSTAKIASAVRNMWEIRTQTKATLSEGTAFELVIKAQIDEVFLILAHLGEAILPLGVFDKDYYLQTLGEVQASIASCGNELLPAAWAELDAEVQYACTAGFTICACYSPMPVYRGFGACVLGDWDWACPDMAHLEEKAKKKAIRTVYGFKQKVDPQPTRSVFIAFDSIIQILQVKPTAFLAKRPTISGFAEQQPRFGSKPKKEVKDDFERLEEWVRQLERRGHPVPKDTRLTSWGIPFATWTSPYGCRLLKSHKDCETIIYHQMDPGRLLHAFVCRGGSNLDDGQVVSLPPRSPAESLLCWLEGLPGTSHKVVKWQDLDTEYFEKKINKSMRKKIGQYPLPTQFAVRDPEAAMRPTQVRSASSPAVLGHPPPYSPVLSKVKEQQSPATAELGSPDIRELPATSVSSSPHPKQSVSLPAPGSTASSALKSIHMLRRKPTAQQVGAYSASGTQSTLSPAVIASADAQELPGSTVVASELPSDTAASAPAGPEASTAVELPTDSQSDATNASVTTATETANMSDVPNAHGESKKSGAIQEAESNRAVATRLHSGSQEVIEPQVPGHAPELDTQNLGRPTPERASDSYLDLLKKVASGEISPQALGEMLQKADSVQSIADANVESPTKEHQPG